MLRLLLLWVLWLGHAGVQAQMPSLLLEQAYLKDPAGQLSVEGAAAGPFEAFQGNLGLGFQPGPVWIRLTLDRVDKPAEPGPGSLVLRVGPNYLERIELFQWVDGIWQRQVRGSLLQEASRACPDDLHCFELEAPSTPHSMAYLRISHQGFLVSQVEVLPAQDLPGAVAKRVRAISVSMALALGLLVLGLVLLLTDRSVLLLAYCIFQLTVVLFIAANAGLVTAVLPMLSSEVHHTFTTLLYVMRVTVTGLLVWVFLRPHRPSPLFHRVAQLMLVACALNALLVLAGHTQWGLKGSLLVFSLLPFCLLYGTLSATDLPAAQRRVLLTGISIYLLMLSLGLWSNFRDQPLIPKFAFVQQLVDWRLNGFAVGVLFFWLTMLERASQKRVRARELEALRGQALEARAHQAELDERSALIDMLTHELKNPLGTIGFALASLKQQVRGNQEVMTRILNIDASARRMDDLIERVASLSKIERATPSGRPPVLEAAAFVQELLADMAEPQQWQVQVQPGATFRCDRQLLWVIIENLMTNASKYGLPEQDIRINVTMDGGPDAPGAPDADKPSRRACLEISNHVAPDCVPDASILFDRYYRHPGVMNKAGMGLGLSVVKSAAHKVGGEVAYRHAQGQVFFTLKVPA